VIDPQHRVLFWNKACEELTGVKSAEVVGTTEQWKPFYEEKRPTLSDLLIEGQTHKLPDYYGKFNNSLLTKEGFQAEGWYPNLGGKGRHIFFDAAPVRDFSGKVLAAIETFRDITEHKMAEQNVLREKMFNEALIDSVPGLFFLLHPFFKFLARFAQKPLCFNMPLFFLLQRLLA